MMQMMFRVKDLEASKQYYTEALGMKLLRETDNEKVRMPAAASAALSWSLLLSLMSASARSASGG